MKRNVIGARGVKRGMRAKRQGVREGNASREGQEGRNAGGSKMRTKGLNEVLFESFK